MNQYTDVVILNSDCWTIPSSVVVGKEAFRIKGIANFRRAGSTYKLSKKAGVGDGTPDKATITIAETRTEVEGWQKDAIYRLWIELGERNSHTSEFQNSLTRENKVLTWEVSADSAKAAADKLAKLIAKQNRDSKNVKITVTHTADTALLTLVAVDEFVTIKTCQLQVLTVGPWETLTGYDHYDVLIDCAHVATATTSGSANEIVDGKAGFGSASWIARNLRLPTLANTSWTAVVKDQARPIPGKVYDEYVLVQTTDRGELTGMGAVGQALTSVTRHVFFVEHGAAVASGNGFEAKICACLDIDSDDVEDLDA